MRVDEMIAEGIEHHGGVEQARTRDVVRYVRDRFGHTTVGQAVSREKRRLRRRGTLADQDRRVLDEMHGRLGGAVLLRAVQEVVGEVDPEPPPGVVLPPVVLADSYTSFATKNRVLVRRAVAAKVPGFETAAKIEDDLLKPVFNYLLTGETRAKGRGKIASRAAHKLLSDIAAGKLAKEKLDKMLASERKGEAIRAYVYRLSDRPDDLVTRMRVYQPEQCLDLLGRLRATYPAADPDQVLARLAKLAEGMPGEVEGLETPERRLRYLVDAVSDGGMAHYGPDQHEETLKTLEDDPVMALRYMWVQMTKAPAGEFTKLYPDLADHGITHDSGQ